MKNTDYINKIEIEKLLTKTISNDKLINRQKEELESFGFTFRDIDILVDYENDKNYEVDIKFGRPAFTKKILSRYDLEEIDFDYDSRNMEIEIFNIKHNEYSTNEKKLSRTISKEISKLKEMSSGIDNLMYEGIKISSVGDNIEDLVETQIEKNKYEVKRIKKEIEDTINAKLELLREDIKDITNRIREVIENYNDNLENKKFSIKNALKNMLNKRAIRSVIHKMKSFYQKTLLEKKLKLQKVNMELSQISYLKNITSLGEEIAKKQMLLNKKSILKQEYQYFKQSKKIIYTNIDEIVEEKNREYTIELMGEVENAEDIVIDEHTLLRYCIPEYKNLMKTYEI